MRANWPETGGIRPRRLRTGRDRAAFWEESSTRSWKSAFSCSLYLGKWNGSLPFYSQYSLWKARPTSCWLVGLGSVCCVFGGTVLQALSWSWSVERRVQVRVWVKSDGDQGVLSDRQVVVSGEDGGPKPLLGRQLGRTHREPGRDMQTRDSWEGGRGPNWAPGTWISGCLFGSVFSSVRARTLREL